MRNIGNKRKPVKKGSILTIVRNDEYNSKEIFPQVLYVVMLSEIEKPAAFTLSFISKSVK